MNSCSFSRLHSYLNGVHSSRKEFAPGGANSFLEDMTLLRKEDKKTIIVELLHLKEYSFSCT